MMKAPSDDEKTPHHKKQKECCLELHKQNTKNLLLCIKIFYFTFSSLIESCFAAKLGHRWHQQQRNAASLRT